MAIKRHESFAAPAVAWRRSEIIEPLGMSIVSLAEKLGVSLQR